jgi:hypothetical protein
VMGVASNGSGKCHGAFLCVWGGGILMGAKEEVLELEDYEIGEFYASMVLRHGL